MTGITVGFGIAFVPCLFPAILSAGALAVGVAYVTVTFGGVLAALSAVSLHSLLRSRE